MKRDSLHASRSCSTPPTALRRAGLVLRCAALVAATCVAGTALGRLAWSVCQDAGAPLVAEVRGHGVTVVATLPLADVLTCLAAVAALCCVLRLAVESLVVAFTVAVTALRRAEGAATAAEAADWGRWARHRPVRRLLLGLVGISLGAGALVPAHAVPAHAVPAHAVPAHAVPAHAVPAGHTSGGSAGRTAAAASADTPLAGLALPDRTVGGAPPPTVTVHPGDSLWTIADAAAGRHATTRTVAACWHRLLQVNARRLGRDPDLLFPGTHLVVPRCDRPRKDRP